jgi:hypothetical protein
MAGSLVLRVHLGFISLDFGVPSALANVYDRCGLSGVGPEDSDKGPVETVKELDLGQVAKLGQPTHSM